MNSLDQLLLDIKNNRERDTVLKQICKTTADLVPRANLISLWRFNASNTTLKNLIAYDLNQDQFSIAPDLNRSEYESYFNAIVENELIVASDARKHSSTLCFTEHYFKPNNIYSLLDFIIHKDFRPIGVICCESKGKQVQWSTEDEDNLRMLAVLISFQFNLEQP